MKQQIFNAHSSKCSAPCAPGEHLLHMLQKSCSAVNYKLWCLEARELTTKYHHKKFSDENKTKMLTPRPRLSDQNQDQKY